MIAAAIAQIRMGSEPVWPGVYRTGVLTAGGLVLVAGPLIAARRGVSWWRAAACLLAAAAGVAVGARLLHAATDFRVYQADPGRLLAASFSDFALYGGLIGGTAVGLAACRLLRVNTWVLADSAAPPVALGIAAIRVGCFLNGCCYGVPTEVPWGVVYPPGSDVHLHQAAEDLAVLVTGPMPVHPTQLYELAAALLAGALAVWVMRRKAPAGSACLSAAIAFTAFRLFNEPLRAAPADTSVPQAFYPILYAVVIALALLALTWRLRGALGERGKHKAATSRNGPSTIR